MSSIPGSVGHDDGTWPVLGSVSLYSIANSDSITSCVIDPKSARKNWIINSVKTTKARIGPQRPYRAGRGIAEEQGPRVQKGEEKQKDRKRKRNRIRGLNRVIGLHIQLET
jgi:hypothetical protein